MQHVLARTVCLGIVLKSIRAIRVAWRLKGVLGIHNVEYSYQGALRLNAGPVGALNKVSDYASECVIPTSSWLSCMTPKMSGLSAYQHGLTTTSAYRWTPAHRPTYAALLAFHPLSDFRTPDDVTGGPRIPLYGNAMRSGLRREPLLRCSYRPTGSQPRPPRGHRLPSFPSNHLWDITAALLLLH